MDTEALDTALDVASAAADSAAVIVLPRDFEPRPFDATLDTARLAGVDTLDVQAFTEEEYVLPPAWESGLEPTPRIDHPGNRTSFLAVIAIIFIVMAYNFRHMKRLVKMYFEETTKVRRGRDNVFDERPAGDTRILILLLVQMAVCAGVLLAGGVTYHILGGGTPVGMLYMAKVIGIVGVYYLLQLGVYRLVGYTFASGTGMHEWVRGFNASQALLGLALAVPAVVSVFYPPTLLPMVAIGAICYFAARLLFIFKGFRIFYDKISSLLYFILYLCTLEIIPVIWVYICSVRELI